MNDINWAGLLDQEDVEALWNGLFQLLSRHPAVRPLHFATDGAAVSSPMEINADLAQELFLELFKKQRFEHYVNNGYSSKEIENEIAHLEVPNLVGARLRKRYPESFRMARRVSSLLKRKSRFRRFGIDDEIDAEKGEEPALEKTSCGRRGRMVNQIFGLREWARSKPMTDSNHFAELVKSVPMRRRDTRCVGRSGSSQLILSNPDLEALIIEVLVAIDSPSHVRTLRQLVLSKIPLQDYSLSSLDEELHTENGSTLRRDPSCSRETPEGELLRGERNREAARMADQFLISLRRAVNNNSRRFARVLSTLWHCYYDTAGPSQLEIADILGVSDSLVSDNRRLIENELKKLKLSREDGPVFSESLEQLIVQATLANLNLPKSSSLSVHTYKNEHRHSPCL